MFPPVGHAYGQVKPGRELRPQQTELLVAEIRYPRAVRIGSGKRPAGLVQSARVREVVGSFRGPHGRVTVGVTPPGGRVVPDRLAFAQARALKAGYPAAQTNGGAPTARRCTPYCSFARGRASISGGCPEARGACNAPGRAVHQAPSVGGDSARPAGDSVEQP